MVAVSTGLPRAGSLSTTDRDLHLAAGRWGECAGLGLAIEVAGVVALEQLAGRLTPGAVDLAPTLHGWTQCKLVGPAQRMRALVRAQEPAGLAKLAFDPPRAVPGFAPCIASRLARPSPPMSMSQWTGRRRSTDPWMRLPLSSLPTSLSAPAGRSRRSKLNTGFSLTGSNALLRSIVASRFACCRAAPAGRADERAADVPDAAARANRRAHPARLLELEAKAHGRQRTQREVFEHLADRVAVDDGGDHLDIGQPLGRNRDRHVHRVFGEGRPAHLHARIELDLAAVQELAFQVGPLKRAERVAVGLGARAGRRRTAAAQLPAGGCSAHGFF